MRYEANTNLVASTRDFIFDGDIVAVLANMDPEDPAYASIQELADECEAATGDFGHGAILINDAYFTEYARELAHDVGAITDNRGWPYTCIDWQRAARELQMDYTPVEYDGVTFWVR